MKAVLTLVFISVSLTVSSQDQPRSCSNEVPTLEPLVAAVVGEARTAKDYFMNCSASDVGNTYEERMANLKNKVNVIVAKFTSGRTDAYSQHKCQYYKTKSATSKSGKVRKKASITIPKNYEFIKSSLKHTTNGDMKDGPHIKGKQIVWVTGTVRGRAETFVQIEVKYTQDYITKSLEKELQLLKVELGKNGIPTN